MAWTPKPQRRRIAREARRARRRGWDREYSLVLAGAANRRAEFARIQARLDAGALSVLHAVRAPAFLAPFAPVTQRKRWGA